MAGFSKEQEAFIETVAWRVGEKVTERLSERIEERIKAHQNGCPHGKKIAKIALLCTTVGAAIGCAGSWAWAKVTGN